MVISLKKMPRHVSAHYAQLNFVLSKLDKGYVALCLVCGRYLKNTASKRILAHRNICREADPADVKIDHSETSVDSKNASLPIIDQKSPRGKMRSRGEVWKFFNFDKETKRVSCKYCNKQYKRNATRMQEHLNVCDSFQASDEKTEFEVKYRNKELGGNRVLENIETDDLHNEDVTFETDLIQVEHRYNTITPTERSHMPLKRRYVEDGTVNYATYVNEDRKDEFDIFGVHVANELRKIKRNAILLANTKHELNEILHKAVIESLKSESYVQVVVDNLES